MYSRLSSTSMMAARGKGGSLAESRGIPAYPYYRRAACTLGGSLPRD